MSVVKIIEVVGRSTTSSDDAVKSALAEASRSLRNIKALDVVSVGLRGDNMDEWGAHVRISFLVENVTMIARRADLVRRRAWPQPVADRPIAWPLRKMVSDPVVADDAIVVERWS